jgi:hypothetical protein
MFRAVECSVPGCQHIHAANDEGVVALLLRHTHQAHPGVRMDESSAQSLVEDKGYDDQKHAKKKGFFDTVGDAGGGFGGPG